MSNLPAADLPVKESLSEAEQRKLDRARERETYTYFNDGDEELRVSTCHEWVASTLRRRGARLIQVSGGGRSGPKCWIFEAPRSWYRIPLPPRGKLKLTEQQKQAARERLVSLRSSTSRSTKPRELVPVEGETSPGPGSVRENIVENAREGTPTIRVESRRLESRPSRRSSQPGCRQIGISRECRE